MSLALFLELRDVFSRWACMQNGPCIVMPLCTSNPSCPVLLNDFVQELFREPPCCGGLRGTQCLLVNFAELEVHTRGPSFDPCLDESFPKPILHGAFFLHASLTVPRLMSDNDRPQDLFRDVVPWQEACVLIAILSDAGIKIRSNVGRKVQRGHGDVVTSELLVQGPARLACRSMAPCPVNAPCRDLEELATAFGACER